MFTGWELCPQLANARSALRFSRAGRAGLPARRFHRPFCGTSRRRNDAEYGPMESGEPPGGFHRRAGVPAAANAEQAAAIGEGLSR